MKKTVAVATIISVVIIVSCIFLCIDKLIPFKVTLGIGLVSVTATWAIWGLDVIRRDGKNRSHKSERGNGLL